jgi:hypothetical protein
MHNRLLLPTCGSILIVPLLVLSSVPMGAGRVDLDSECQSLDLEELGMEIGIQVVLEGRGVVFSRAAAAPRSAASAIKTAIALDLFSFWGEQLDQVPSGLGSLLRTGTHPAFNGFTPEQLKRARAHLAGRPYLELARIMMGRTQDSGEVYNAACNVIMIKLGGPDAITRRLRALDPAFAGFDLNRYMQSWNGNGDNTATPEALVTLYRMTASGHIPGLGEEQVETFRALLLQEGDGGPGSVFEKMGTLYPDPMVRVRAGYLERGEGDLVYAVMGEIAGFSDEDPAALFERLMTTVDEMAVLCRGVATPEED